MAGSIPLAEVFVALCVPESCGPAALQAALKRSLLRASASDIAFDVRVADEYCVSHAELDGNPFGVAQLLFWYCSCPIDGLSEFAFVARFLAPFSMCARCRAVVVSLSVAAVSAPFVG